MLMIESRSPLGRSDDYDGNLVTETLCSCPRHMTVPTPHERLTSSPQSEIKALRAVIARRLPPSPKARGWNRVLEASGRGKVGDHGYGRLLDAYYIQQTIALTL